MGVSGYLKSSRSCRHYDHLLARHEKVAVDVILRKHCHRKRQKDGNKEEINGPTPAPCVPTVDSKVDSFQNIAIYCTGHSSIYRKQDQTTTYVTTSNGPHLIMS